MTSSRLRTTSALDISETDLNEISVQSTQLIANYFGTISQRGVVAEKNYAGRTLANLDAKLESDPVPVEKLMAECRTMFDLSRHNGHPRFFGYIASPSTPIGAYADLLASTLNQNVTSWRSSPAATEVERLVV